MKNQKINLSGFIAYINRPKNMILENMRNITQNKQWKDECEALLKEKSFSLEFIETFHTHWVESAHHIRSQVSNDARLIELLRHIFPRYNGKGVLLYRGENIDRFRTNSVGFCWTQDIEVARMFARGLNAVKAGGVLLSCMCKKDWIITGPNAHSNYLGEGEYVVDVLKMSNIESLGTFKAVEIIR